MRFDSRLAVIFAVAIFTLPIAIWWLNTRSQPVAAQLHPAPAPTTEFSTPRPPARVETPLLPPSFTPTQPPQREPALAEADIPTRQRYFDQLAAEVPFKILNRWRRASAAPQDEVTLALIQQAFTQSLSRFQKDDPELVAALSEPLTDPGFPIACRAAFAQALADSSTLVGTRALVENATSAAPGAELQETVLGAIASIGAERRADGSYPAELSPALEAAFGSALADPANKSLAKATGHALGQLGTESGVHALLDAFAASAQADGSDPTRPLERAFRNDLEHIRNPAAVPALMEVISGVEAAADSRDPLLTASGTALVNIGGEEAVGPLLDMLELSPANAKALASAWFANIRQPETIEVVRQRLKNSTFASPVIKSTLEQLLNANLPEEVPPALTPSFNP